MADLRRLPLPSNGWTVRATGGVGSPLVGDADIDVPPHAAASIHATLSRAGIQAPWHGERAELESEWVGRTAWTFTREIDVPSYDDGRHCACIIETLDGPCEIALGGIVLGNHASEHVPFEARVPDALRGVRTKLEIRFRAPVDEVLAWQQKLGTRPVNGDWLPFSFARSAACGFGWDWGPRVAGVGFYGARFDCWEVRRITGISVAQRWNDDGTLTVRVTPQGDFDRGALVCIVREREASSVDGVQRVECDARGEATIRPARLWTSWDRGSREGCWWNAMVGVRDERGVFKPLATARFAPRRIELDTAVDNVGRRFRFVLNGEAIFARGANLIPPLLGAQYEFDWLSEMRRYRDTGFNMVRVWGGGNYLPDAFYEACDELGILVWQDFMFACATYPEDEPFATLVAREAAHQVARLARHPSLALWCGGNEDILAWWSWGWKERLAPGQSWGLHYWTETLPAAVAAHDPGTPYWTESPYSGSMELHPNDPDHGDRHTWDAEAKIEGYRTILPRFSSEFGHQSPPCWQTIIEDCLDPMLLSRREPNAMSAADLVEALKLRQKAWGGDDVQYKPFLAARFRDARSAREYVAQAQHLQARAMDVAMRWLRAGAPRSMGALIWQWNDVWAGHSWSLVDAAGRLKPSWYAVRRACAPRQLSIEPTGGFAQQKPGSLEVVLSDDRAFTDPAWLAAQRVIAVLERVDFHGEVKARVRVELLPHAECGFPAATLRGRIPENFLVGCVREHECIVARVEGDATIERAVEFLAGDAELKLPRAALEIIGEVIGEVVGESAASRASVNPDASLNVAASVHPEGSTRLRTRASVVIREFWIEQTWLTSASQPPSAPRAGSVASATAGTEGPTRALEAIARDVNWRTFLPGEELLLPAGVDLTCWSANELSRRD
ncbi:MAG: glycosyl hydrolase 2 galactose-binding domain-containing protein [bacterium]